MGVEARIVVYSADRERAFTGAEAAFARLGELDAVLSDYRPSSELMRLCAAPHGVCRTVGHDLHMVLAASIDVAEATDGAFDPTLGPLTRMWREARRNGRMPTSSEVETARIRTGYRHVRVGKMTATLMMPGMSLDLGGIGKGYAAAAARDVLRTRGLPICLVALSGDVALGDSPPGERGWMIALDAIRAPQPDSRSLEDDQEGPLSVVLSNCSISTAAGSEQYFEWKGVRYSHILDPRTGFGVTHSLSVTVAGPDGAWVDGLDSALCVLGPERAEEVVPLLRPGMACMVRQLNQNGGPAGTSRATLVIDPGNLLGLTPAVKEGTERVSVPVRASSALEKPNEHDRR